MTSGATPMAGIRLNTPLLRIDSHGVGDYVAAQVIYTEGALRYLFQNPTGNYWIQDGSVLPTASCRMVSMAAALQRGRPPVST